MQMQNSGKPKKTTNFEKKKNEKDNRACYVCGKEEHLAKNCRHRKNKDNEQKAVNVTIGKNGDEAGSAGYGNLQFVFLAIQPTDWRVDTGANVHVCSDMSLFSSYQGARTSSILMGNGLAASVLGVGMVDLKLSSGKDCPFEERASCSNNKQESR
jgi:hypothetical protein